MRAPQYGGLWLSFAASTSMAMGPQQLDQLEPARDAWQAEYSGTFSKADHNEQALEAIYGVSDRLAIGIELEGEYGDGALEFETLGVKALYRLTPPDAALGAGLQLQLGFDEEASLAEAEARLILEAQNASWWSQANVMLRRPAENGRSDLSGAYAWSLQRSVAEAAWLGLEGSGDWVRTGCDGDRCKPSSHFVGPSLTVELEHDGVSETEIGLAALRSISESNPHFIARLFIQTTF